MQEIFGLSKLYRVSRERVYKSMGEIINDDEYEALCKKMIEKMTAQNSGLSNSVAYVDWNIDYFRIHKKLNDPNSEYPIHMRVYPHLDPTDVYDVRVAVEEDVVHGWSVGEIKVHRHAG